MDAAAACQQGRALFLHLPKLKAIRPVCNESAAAQRCRHRPNDMMAVCARAHKNIVCCTFAMRHGAVGSAGAWQAIAGPP